MSALYSVQWHFFSGYLLAILQKPGAPGHVGQAAITWRAEGSEGSLRGMLLKMLEKVLLRACTVVITMLRLWVVRNRVGIEKCGKVVLRAFVGS